MWTFLTKTVIERKFRTKIHLFNSLNENGLMPLFFSFQVSVYCCTVAATVKIFPRADPIHAWTTGSVVCTLSLTVLRDTRANARGTSQAKDVKLRYRAPPNHVVPVDSASIIRLVCVAHVKPCLYVSFITPFLVPFKNRSNAVLWCCIHMTSNRSKVPLTKAVTLMVCVNEALSCHSHNR